MLFTVPFNAKQVKNYFQKQYSCLKRRRYNGFLTEAKFDQKWVTSKKRLKITVIEEDKGLISYNKSTVLK